MFIKASGKYPFSLYPEYNSPSAVVQLVGKTGKPKRSPSLFESFPFPSGRSNKGKCANFGASQPKAS